MGHQNRTQAVRPQSEGYTDLTGGGGTSIRVIVGAAVSPLVVITSSEADLQVGGAIGIAMIGVLIWFCLKKRRKAK